MVDTLTTQPLEQANIYDRNLLYRAQQAQVLYGWGQKKNIKKNDGNTIRWRRFNALATNTSTLVEGITPAPTALSMSEVTATVAQYGAYGMISDMIDLVGIDPVLSEASDVFGQQAGESIETVVTNVVAAGTSVLYGTGSTRGAQSAAAPMTIALLRKALRNLDRNNTKRFNGEAQNSKVGNGYYNLLLHPNVVYDLQNDPEWKNMQQNIKPELLANGAMAMILNVMIYQSTLAPVFTGAGSGGVDVYGSILIGQNAFGVVDVAGTGKFKMIAKPLGSAGTADPLDQRATVGWKSVFATKILNDLFMLRIETGATL